MYKNTFICGIPNAGGTGDSILRRRVQLPEAEGKLLKALADVTPADNDTVRKLVDEGRIKVKLSGQSSHILIGDAVKTAVGIQAVTTKRSRIHIEDGYNMLCQYVKIETSIC